MAIILPGTPSLGASLGTAIGGGLAGYLTGLAHNKARLMGEEDIANALIAAGFNETEAHALSKLSENDRTTIIRERAQEKINKISPEARSALSKLGLEPELHALSEFGTTGGSILGQTVKSKLRPTSNPEALKAVIPGLSDQEATQIASLPPSLQTAYFKHISAEEPGIEENPETHSGRYVGSRQQKAGVQPSLTRPGQAIGQDFLRPEGYIPTGNAPQAATRIRAEEEEMPIVQAAPQRQPQLTESQKQTAPLRQTNYQQQNVLQEEQNPARENRRVNEIEQDLTSLMAPGNQQRRAQEDELYEAQRPKGTKEQESVLQSLIDRRTTKEQEHPEELTRAEPKKEARKASPITARQLAQRAFPEIKEPEMAAAPGQPLTKAQQIERHRAQKARTEQKSKLENETRKIQAQIDKDTKSYFDEINSTEKAAADNDLRLGRMEKLISKKNINHPALASALNTLAHIPYIGVNLKSLLTADSQEFDKLSTDFLKGAKAIFGARMTEKEVLEFLKTVPTLMQSDEGKVRVIRNLKGFNDGSHVKYNAMRDIIEENDGHRPYNLQALVNERTKEKLDEINKKMVLGYGNYQLGLNEAKLPPASAHIIGALITKNGQQYVNAVIENGKQKWLPVFTNKKNR